MSTPLIERIGRSARIGAFALLAAALAAPAPVDAQFPDDVVDAAEEAAKGEVSRQVEAFVENAVKCAFDNFECIQSAKERGEDVVLTDEDGEVMYDEEGQPITDPDQLPPERRRKAGGPAENYDFQRGERRVLFEDYREDVAGDFPRAFRWVKGNVEVVDFEGRRALKLSGEKGRFLVPLPETLPERFTLEMPVHLPPGNQRLRIFTDVPPELNYRSFEGHFVVLDRDISAGISSRGLERGGRSVVSPPSSLHERFVPLEVMADGGYVKVFLDGQRVGNVPRAKMPRSDTLMVAAQRASADDPVYVGPLRIHAGGRDMYDALAAEGRVAVQDILFATDSDEIRPESADALEAIARMLGEHPDLELLIEGHTDAQGAFDHNMQLSKDRAASVKRYLVEQHGVAGERLRTVGLGQTQPVASNDTEDGRQQNRRVELVRIEGN